MLDYEKILVQIKTMQDYLYGLGFRVFLDPSDSCATSSALLDSARYFFRCNQGRCINPKP